MLASITTLEVPTPFSLCQKSKIDIERVNTMELDSATGIKLANFIYTINQDLKNSKKDTTYSIRKGKFISFKRGNELLHNFCVPNISSRNNDIAGYVNGLNGFVNGKELFDFFKEYKKHINGMEINKNNFSILTSLPEIKYESAPINRNLKYDIAPWKEFKNTLQIIKTPKRLVTSFELTDSHFEEMAKRNAPAILNKDGIKIRVVPKMFLGRKAKSSCNLEVFELDKSSDLYLVNIILDNPSFSSNNYMIIVNY